MMRHLRAFAAVSPVIGLAWGCFGSGPVYYPTGAACAPGTNPDCEGPQCTAEELVDPTFCQGETCLVLELNLQGVDGLCTSPCFVDDDCTPHERCLQIPEGAFCFRACLADDDCYDGTVCRPVIGDASQFCLVDQF